MEAIIVFHKIILPILAFVGLSLGALLVYFSTREIPPASIPFEPAVSPYKTFVAASGMVEANSENINIGTPFNNTIEKVFVKAGDFVKKGDPLFRLDTSTLLAEEEEKESTLSANLAEYNRQISEPRPEKIPVKKAELEKALAEYENLAEQFAFYERVMDKNAYSESEYTQALYAKNTSFFQMEKAKADLELLLAGTWSEELAVTKERVDEALASRKVTESKIERSIIKAPIDGQVLQIKARPGQLAEMRVEGQNPLCIMGAVDPLRIRIDIDEDNAWRYKEKAKAQAFVRGNSKMNYPLTYVRVEPYIIPKQSYTGSSGERVDTRVLQVIYQFPTDKLPIYAGQVMDIFIEAPPYEESN